MASILTNTSAMTALMTLRSINKDLSTVQDQISTGKKVATAKDNAASFAIAAIMKADVAGFKALSESLATGSATVGVARAGAETVVDLLEELKGRIVAANSDSADRTKIQSDVDALRNQIIETVNASQFNGLNLLQADANDPVTEVLSSLNRASDGTVTATNISVGRNSLEAGTGTALYTTTGAAAATTALNIANISDYAAGDIIGISLRDLNTGENFTVSTVVTAEDIAAAGTSAVLFVAAVGTRLAAQFDALEVEGAAIGDVGFTGSNLTVDIAASTAGAEFEVFQTTSGLNQIAAADFALGENNFNLTMLGEIDVSSKAGAQSALQAIEGLIQTTVTAASNFGSAQKRIGLQQEFVQSLTDSLTTGIGALVDADLEAASARLQALQVQQQLGTQSLTIANSQPQNILALFR